MSNCATDETGNSSGTTSQTAMALLALVTALALAGCKSLSPSVDDDAPVEIRQVVTERAAFYDSYPAADSIPFIYLTRGTPVQWLEEKSSFSMVKLANGSPGWVPNESLGASSYGDSQQRAASDASLPFEAAPGSSSSAIRAAPDDDSLNEFNRP